MRSKAKLYLFYYPPTYVIRMLHWWSCLFVRNWHTRLHCWRSLFCWGVSVCRLLWSNHSLFWNIITNNSFLIKYDKMITIRGSRILRIGYLKWWVLSIRLKVLLIFLSWILALLQVLLLSSTAMPFPERSFEFLQRIFGECHFGRNFNLTSSSNLEFFSGFPYLFSCVFHFLRIRCYCLWFFVLDSLSTTESLLRTLILVLSIFKPI